MLLDCTLVLSRLLTSYLSCSFYARIFCSDRFLLPKNPVSMSSDQVLIPCLVHHICVPFGGSLSEHRLDANSRVPNSDRRQAGGCVAYASSDAVLSRGCIAASLGTVSPGIKRD
jgi:hypothetical protein